jgi:hypothetical protein
MTSNFAPRRATLALLGVEVVFQLSCGSNPKTTREIAAASRPAESPTDPIIIAGVDEDTFESLAPVLHALDKLTPVKLGGGDPVTTISVPRANGASARTSLLEHVADLRGVHLYASPDECPTIRALSSAWPDDDDWVSIAMARSNRLKTCLTAADCLELGGIEAQCGGSRMIGIQVHVKDEKRAKEILRSLKKDGSLESLTILSDDDD